ncbi:MAG: 2'-5' RNA ligase family protein, partial [Pseudomonadota bacterium]
MIRAFLALPLPDALRDRLEDVALDLGEGRPVAWENFHVTLAFLGELPGPALEDAAWELDGLDAPAPRLVLDGLGVFGAQRPRSAHAVVRPDP